MQKNKVCSRCGLVIEDHHQVEYTFNGARHTADECVRLLQEKIKGQADEKRLRPTGRAKQG